MQLNELNFVSRKVIYNVLKTYECIDEAATRLLWFGKQLFLMKSHDRFDQNVVSYNHENSPLSKMKESAPISVHFSLKCVEGE